MVNWPDSLIRSTAPTVFTSRPQRHRGRLYPRRGGTNRDTEGDSIRGGEVRKETQRERRRQWAAGGPNLDSDYEMLRNNKAKMSVTKAHRGMSDAGERRVREMKELQSS